MLTIEFISTIDVVLIARFMSIKDISITFKSIVIVLIARFVFAKVLFISILFVSIETN